MPDSSHSRFEDNALHTTQAPGVALSIVTVINSTDTDTSQTLPSNDNIQTPVRIPNERRQDKFIANGIGFTLTDKHIAQIESLKLGIQINNAIFAIDSLVNNANMNMRLSLNDAVRTYCNQQQNSYNLWLLKVQEFAKKHNITVVNVISILDDVAFFNELHWSSGIKRKFISKFKIELASYIRPQFNGEDNNEI